MDKHAAIWLTDHDLNRLRHLVADSSRRAHGAQAGAETLEDMLDLGRVVPPGDIPRDIVTMNSQVVFEETATGERRSIRVVYPEDADPAAGRVSVLTPVGVALLGACAGAEATLPLPHGRTMHIRIVEVTYQPEADGELSL